MPQSMEVDSPRQKTTSRESYIGVFGGTSGFLEREITWTNYKK